MMKHFLAPIVAAFLLVGGADRLQAIEKGTQEKAQKENLKPGEYVWEPETASKGSVDVVVSLAAQQLFVYRDGVQIGRSTISTGSKGRETPKGIYMILEKNLTHHSNKYHEASMPFMERLTWGGLAIHAGNTPGHPESHGCIHVPEDFAKKLYGLTEEGDSVLVADDETKPVTTSDPNLLFAGSGTPDAAPAPGGTPAFTWKPEEVPTGPVLVVLSSADKHVYVYRKGVEIGRADLGGTDAGHPLGEHVYAALAETLPDGMHPWSLLGSGDGAAAPDFQSVVKGMEVPGDFLQKVRGLIAPGTTLVLTDQAASPTKPSGPDAED